MATLDRPYPCIIDSSMPAFIAKQGCDVYFSLSNFNNVADIGIIQVSIRNQKTNASVLESPTELYLVEKMEIDETKLSDDKYYIHIPGEILKGKKFKLNQYYKVQIRLTHASVKMPAENESIQSWINGNKSYFSEWSTICLIHPISQPQLVLQNFEEAAAANTNAILSFSNIELIGTVKFDSADSETLKSYRIRLSELNSDDVLVDEIKYSNTYSNPNEINYLFDYYFENDSFYHMIINIETKNGYKKEYVYNFKIEQSTGTDLKAFIDYKLDFDMGGIVVNITNNGMDNFIGNLIIRRASNKTNFTVWEDVHITPLVWKKGESNNELIYSWVDYTAEFGVLYHYGVQSANSLGQRGKLIEAMVESEEGVKEVLAVLADFEDMFLMANDKQLRIRYDAKVDNFARNISESKTTTIGSKYPFIVRNGDMDYKSFGISGIITFLNDENFLSKEEVYGSSAAKYEEYNKQNNVNEYTDYMYEKVFREKVMDYLYDNNAKSLRTNTEGNMIVKLTDISFSPKTELGNYIYSFSATAQEIDEYSIKNLDKYNIQTVGTVQVAAATTEQLSQFNGILSANQDLLERIGEDLSSKLPEGSKSIVEVLYFTELSIVTGNNNTKNNFYNIVIEDGKPVYTTEYTGIEGIIFKINGEDVLIQPNKIYTLKTELNKPVFITSLSCEKQLDFTSEELVLTYKMLYTEKEDTDNLPIATYYQTVYGQYGRQLKSGMNQSRIFTKYRINDAKGRAVQKITEFSGLDFFVPAGTIITYKSRGDEKATTITVNDTARYTLTEKDYAITEFSVKNSSGEIIEGRINYIAKLEKGVYK